MDKICEYCEKIFHKKKNYSFLSWEKVRFCSKECKDKSQKGIKNNNHSKKMKEAWKKGAFQNRLPTRYINMGKLQKGKNNPNWRGDKSSIKKYFKNQSAYVYLHQRIRKIKGIPKKCEFCNSVDNVQWANKSHTYKEDLDDWIQLCIKCHAKYDRDNFLAK